jgi:Subtilase family
VLTRRWAAIATALGVFTITLGAAPALAGPIAPAVPVSGSPFPSGAFQRLSQDAGSAWQISTGRGVTIAVLSTGVEPSVPGLKGRVTTGPDYTHSAHPDRITGTLEADNLAGNGDPADPSQAAGIAPGARILSIRTDEDSDEPGSNSFYSNASYDHIIAQGIRYAAGHGAQVILVEGGGTSQQGAFMESAVAYAVSRGAVIVANDLEFGGDAESIALYGFPAALPGVIGVGSVNLAGQPAAQSGDGSAQNESILVAAPGGPINGPVTEGQGYYIDGSPAAAVWVAGTAALIKSVTPHLSPALVARAMALSARDHPPGGYSTTLGFGLIDPYQALNEAVTLNRTASTQAAAGVTGGSLGQAAGAAFRPGPALPPIEAVHHAPGKLAGYGAAIVVGVLCLAAALVLMLRRRRTHPGQAGPGPGPAGSEQLAEPQ